MKRNEILIKLIRHFAIYLIILTFLTWVIGVPTLIDVRSKVTFPDHQLEFGWYLYILGSLKGIIKSILQVGAFIIGTQILVIVARNRKKLRFVSK
jgi:hypothetical protein